MESWYVFSFITLVLWGLWGFVAKLATKQALPLDVKIFETIGALLVVIGILVFVKFRIASNPAGLWLAILAGFIGSLGAMFFYFALSKGKLSAVMPLTALYPLVTVFLGVLILKEELTLIQGIGIGFAILAIVLLAL